LSISSVRRFFQEVDVKALFAASLAALAVLCVPSLAQSPPIVQGAGPIKRTILSRQDVPGTNMEVVFVQVEIAANSRIDRHTHPGPVMAYVLDGRSAVAFDGEAPVWFSAGDTFKVDAGRIHAELTEQSPVRLLAVFTVPKGQPLATPAPQ
jgi:quercetin dioxygenase-like cupin family protein